ncbi:PLDc N-terminal domain-containing protein [Radiobacillus sp. PE A8.2]|uniref:PLDc N-terminal domain-containing protein n=1 Tax=Radiobacillus sp. PE A8.2 TaxID=3380349 RepID=UPI00388E03E3
MELAGIDLAVLAPIFIIEFLLFIVALIAWIRTPETKGPRWMWLLIIIFIQIVGPILFLILGRRQT